MAQGNPALLWCNSMLMVKQQFDPVKDVDVVLRCNEAGWQTMDPGGTSKKG